LQGGAQALGRQSGRMEAGYWADMVALDAGHPALAGKSGDTLLDSWVFAGSRNCVSDVWSAGRHIVKDGQHIDRTEIAQRYAAFMRHLLA